MRVDPKSPCLCGRPLAYEDCCGRAHAGTPSADAESLMRSRYTAYVLGRADYLLATWHPSTRPPSLIVEDPGLRWLGLEVKRHWEDGPNRAGVEFVARYRVGGSGAVRLHERSRFVREDGCWLYLDANG